MVVFPVPGPPIITTNCFCTVNKNKVQNYLNIFKLKILSESILFFDFGMFEGCWFFLINFDYFVYFDFLGFPIFKSFNLSIFVARGIAVKILSCSVAEQKLQERLQRIARPEPDKILKFYENVLAKGSPKWILEIEDWR